MEMKKNVLWGATALFVSAQLCCGNRVYHDRRTSFDNIDVNLSWSIIEETQSIYLEIVAPVTDSQAWFAFGLSENSGMKGADIALVSLYHEKVFDLNSQDFVLPKMDKIQDWVLERLEVVESAGHTVAQLSRHLTTCDAEDFRLQLNPFHHFVLIAYNPFDSSLPDTHDFSLSINIHTRKQTKELNLFIDEDLLINDPSSDDNGSFVDYLIKNATISTDNGATQYLCSMFNMTQDFNVSRADIIDATGIGILHHVELLKCDEDGSDHTWDFSSAFACGVNDPGFEATMSCNLQFVMSASTAITLPSTMYYNLPPGIYMLETHYDVLDYVNSGSNLELSDSASGMRVHTISENTRENEVGVFRILSDEEYNYYIPAGEKNYEIAFGMHSTCTDALLPPNGIDIILIGGHMHYYGTKVRVDRIRPGNENQPNQVLTIFELANWDFDRQFAHRINFHINPNDTIRVHCFYDSRDATENTWFGFETTDEMCQVYVGYTPKIENLTTVLAVPAHEGALAQSYCGEGQINGWAAIEEFGLESEVYENVHNVGVSKVDVDNGFKTEDMDETNKYCQELVFHEVDLTRNHLVWRINQNFASIFVGIFITLTIYISLGLIQYLVAKFELLDESHSLETIRKVNIYIFSIIFYTIMLILLLLSTPSEIMDMSKNECQVTYTEKIDEEFVDTTYILAVSNCLMMFFVCELFYRQSVKWDLFLHHFLTIFIITALQTSTQYTLNVKTLYMMGFFYLFQIGTEQPLFFALLIRKLDVDWVPEKYHGKLFYFSSIWHYITKIGTTVMILYIFVESLYDCDIFYIYNVSYKNFLQDQDDADWGQITVVVMFILIPVLFCLQMYQGIVFWQIGNFKKIELDIQHSVDLVGQAPAVMSTLTVSTDLFQTKYGNGQKLRTSTPTPQAEDTGTPQPPESADDESRISGES